MSTPDASVDGAEENLLPGASVECPPGYEAVEQLHEMLNPVEAVRDEMHGAIRDHIHANLADGLATRDLMHQAIQDNLYQQLANVNRTVQKMHGKVDNHLVEQMGKAYAHASNLGLGIPQTHQEVRVQLGLPPLFGRMEIPPSPGGGEPLPPPPTVPPDILPNKEYWVACPADGPNGPITTGALPEVIGLAPGHHDGEYVTLSELGGRWWYLSDGPHPTLFSANNAVHSDSCVQPGQPFPQQPPVVPPPVIQPPYVPPPYQPPPGYCPPPIINIPPCPPVQVTCPPGGRTDGQGAGNGQIPLPDLSGPENFANLLFNLQGTTEIDQFVNFYGESVRPIFEADTEADIMALLGDGWVYNPLDILDVGE